MLRLCIFATGCSIVLLCGLLWVARLASGLFYMSTTPSGNTDLPRKNRTTGRKHHCCLALQSHVESDMVKRHQALAFISECPTLSDPTARRSIYLIEEKSEGNNRLSTLSWSPDDEWLAFSRFDGNTSDLYRIRRVGACYSDLARFSAIWNSFLAEQICLGCFLLAVA